MKATRIKSDWLADEGMRLEASFHSAEGRIYKKMIPKSGLDFLPLHQVTSSIFNGPRFARCYVNDPGRGVPFLSSSDILRSDLSGVKYLSKKYTNNLDSLKVREGWTLISCSGTIGNMAYCRKDMDGYAVTQHVMRVVPNGVVPSGYLYAFLASRYGKAMVKEGTYGAVIQHIEPHHIKNMAIPVLADSLMQRIDQLILRTANLRIEASNSIDRAREKFVDRNGIKIEPHLICPSENAIQIGRKVRSSELNSLTLRARNYSLRADTIRKAWEGLSGRKLSELIDQYGLTRGRGGFFKRIDDGYVKGISILSQRDIHHYKPEMKKVVNKNIAPTEIAKRGMIILPAAGTLGESEVFLKPLLVYKNYEGVVLSEVVGRMEATDIETGAYVYVALSTSLAFRYLRAMVYGTNLLYPHWELIKDLNIPIKDNNTKMLVADMAIKGFEGFAEAKQLETKAIQELEQELSKWLD